MLHRRSLNNGERWYTNPDIVLEKWQLEQIRFLSGVSIGKLMIENRHHPVASVLMRNVFELCGNIDTRDPSKSFIIDNLNMAISEMHSRVGCNSTQKGDLLDTGDMETLLMKLIRDLRADNYFFLPKFIHNWFNAVFAGDFTPIEILLKLDWIFYDNRSFSGKNKRFLMNFIISICIIHDGQFFSEEELKYFKEKISDKSDIRNIEILEELGLGVEDVISFLKKYFFHPYWGDRSFNKHFLLLLFLKSPDDISRTNIDVYLNYYKFNSLDKVFSSSNLSENEIGLIKFALDMFTKSRG